MHQPQQSSFAEPPHAPRNSGTALTLARLTEKRLGHPAASPRNGCRSETSMCTTGIREKHRVAVQRCIRSRLAWPALAPSLERRF